MGAGAGHYGLAGMHERAKLVGGKLAVWSELGSGTEAKLTIPASLAYLKSPVARQTMLPPVDAASLRSRFCKSPTQRNRAR